MAVGTEWTESEMLDRCTHPMTPNATDVLMVSN